MKNQLSKSLLATLLVAGSLVSTANAAATKKQSQNTNTSTTTVADVQEKTEQVKSNDEEITNARLRAQLGSKSRWSFKSALGYNGGSLEKPFASIRPNYLASATEESMTSLSGTVAVNYRATDKDNISFGTGVSITDPMHGDITKNAVNPNTGRSTTRYRVSTPYVDWSRGYKAFGLQQVSSVGYYHATDAYSGSIGATGSLSLSQTILGSFGDSNLSGGLAFSMDHTMYYGNVSEEAAPRIQAQDYMRDDLSLSVVPFLEYSFNDTLSFRTVFAYFNYLHFKNEFGNPTEFVRSEPYQSVGLGISVTRDIYLYPNIQFVPRDVRADRTNVGLSANINLF